MKKGRVILVGAGAGFPGLITQAGIDALQHADAVVYDYLANPMLLSHAPESAEKIYVGKRAGNHTKTQDEILEILYQKALEGKKVVRLKGGDPFIFGRGAEEMEYLLNREIHCSAVPGIPAAVALSSYTGIPLTDRRSNTMLHIVTGQTNPDTASPDVDWKLLARSQGTIVIYMGMKTIRENIELLLKEGYKNDMPAAVVQNISLPGQRTVLGTASSIADLASEAGILPPALVILGPTVSLRNSLRPKAGRLAGKTLLVTRASTQAAELAQRLNEEGASVLTLPLISIEKCEDYTKLDSMINDVANLDWIFFTSPNGVTYFFERLHALSCDYRKLAHMRFAAIGSGTAGRLKEYGFHADFVPDTFTSRDFVSEIAAVYDLTGQHILLPRSDIAPRKMIEKLEKCGARVAACDAYRTVPDPSVFLELQEVMQNRDIDVITFTSSSTVDNFVNALGAELFESLKDKIHPASIGPETSTALRRYGIEPLLEAKEHSIDGIFEAIVAFYT